MAKEKIVGFFEENTVEVTIAGEKRRVNKYEAKALQEKIAKNNKKAKA